jgi:hypothetical protein
MLLSDRSMRAVLYLPLLLVFLLRDAGSTVYRYFAYPQNRALRRRLAQSDQMRMAPRHRPLGAEERDTAVRGTALDG